MERWSLQQRIAAVELFITTQSVAATQRGFRQQFQSCDAILYKDLHYHPYNIQVSQERSERDKSSGQYFRAD
jgi:hypothetical protein